MNLLIVTQYFWPEEFRINDLAAGLVERGHRVTVLTGLPNYPSGHLFPGYRWPRNRRSQYRGVSIIRVPLIPRGSASGGRLFLNYVSFAFAASILGPFLCREHYDATLVFQTSPVTVGLPAIWLRRLKKIPVAFWILDLWPESLAATDAIRAPWLLHLVEKIVRLIYRHCDRILVQSRAFIPRIEAFDVAPSRIRYLPSWAEDLYSRPPSTSLDLPFPDGFRIVFAGNIGEAQDFTTILQAAETLRSYADIQWVIVGDGRRTTWVKEQIEMRGLGQVVHLMGRRPVEQMPALFKKADVLLVTLKPEPIFALTIPGKIQSYLASGRPMIAALDGEGARVVREAGAGIACPAGSSDGLAQAVLSMRAKSRAEREAMGRSGREYYEANFDRKRLLAQVENWLIELAKKETVPWDTLAARRS